MAPQGKTVCPIRLTSWVEMHMPLQRRTQQPQNLGSAADGAVIVLNTLELFCVGRLKYYIKLKTDYSQAKMVAGAMFEFVIDSEL